MLIEGKDLREQKRSKLEKVIPLSTPYVLFIEPTNRCNIRCNFCPTGDDKLRSQRPNGSMTWDVYCKLVDDIERFDKKLKKINFYKDGESLLNNSFCNMIHLAKERNISEQLWLKTNGLLLNKELNKELIASGLDMIGISIIHVNNEGYKNTCHKDIDYKELKNNIKHLFKVRKNCKIYVKIADVGLTESDKNKFLNDFGDISDYMAIEGLHGWSKSDEKDFTLGTNSKSLDGIKFKDKLVCPWVFYQLAVNWNGTVSVCNEDWSHGTIIGDINNESLKDIWNGNKLRAIQKMMLEGKRSEHKVCGNCFYVKCAPDNVDKYRTKILEKLNGNI
jgi:radical SAM protein with 4Fe4S-binding SPASM domain